jgi:hypothetical protein
MNFFNLTSPLIVVARQEAGVTPRDAYAAEDPNPHNPENLYIKWHKYARQPYDGGHLAKARQASRITPHPTGRNAVILLTKAVSRPQNCKMIPANID